MWQLFFYFQKKRLIISSPLYKVISYPHKPSIGPSSKKTVQEAVVSIWQRELHRNTILSLKISILFTLFFHLLLSNHHYYLGNYYTKAYSAQNIARIMYKQIHSRKKYKRTHYHRDYSDYSACVQKNARTYHR